MENDKNTENLGKIGKVYSANELCNIIKTCNKNGVTDLKISGIEISFMSQGIDSPQVENTWTPPKVKHPKKVDTTPLKPLGLTDKDLDEIDDLERAQQAIDDPVGYEEQVMNSFMEEEANEETKHI